MTARDGVEGLAVFAEHCDEIVCVILDLVMPRMDGVAAYSELRRLRPDLPVVLSTGYARRDLLSQLGEIALPNILMKPYGTDKLLSVVESTIAVGVRT